MGREVMKINMNYTNRLEIALRVQPRRWECAQALKMGRNVGLPDLIVQGMPGRAHVEAIWAQIGP